VYGDWDDQVIMRRVEISVESAYEYFRQGAAQVQCSIELEPHQRVSQRTLIGNRAARHFVSRRMGKASTATSSTAVREALKRQATSVAERRDYFSDLLLARAAQEGVGIHVRV
jgi:uncharacterized membrane-anchored protein